MVDLWTMVLVIKMERRGTMEDTVMKEFLEFGWGIGYGKEREGGKMLRINQGDNCCNKFQGLNPLRAIFLLLS